MQVTTTSPLFAATLRPDRSVRLAGGWIALALAGIVGAPFLIAMPELALPGLVAYGLAGLGLGAFGMLARRRRRTSQQVRLWPDEVEVISRHAGGDPMMERFALDQVRLRLIRDSYERTTSVVLVCEGEYELELGPFLSSSDKSSFAKAFGAALRQARRAVV
jgi:Integral membrane protein